MKVVRSGLLAVAAMSVIGSGAYAQGREYQPNGARVGSFTVYPSVKVDVEYVDNVFAEDNNGTSDVIGRVNPQVLARSNFKRHQVIARAGVTAAFHENNDDDNTVDANVGIDGRVDASRSLTIRPTVSYRLANEARGSDNVVGNAAEPVEFDVAKAGLGLDYVVGRLAFTLDGSASYVDYDDLALVGGAVDNQDDRDRLELRSQARVAYEVRPKLSLFVTGGIAMFDYDDVDDAVLVKRDSEVYNVGAGVAYNPTARTKVSVGAGYISQSFDNAAFSDVDGVGVNVNAEWQVSALTTLTARAERRIDQSADAAVGSELVLDTRIGVRHELRRNIVVGAGVGYTNREFEGLTSNRDDDIYQARLRADYFITRNFSVGGRYQFTRRISNTTANGFSQNSVLATATARF
ncbi:MAG: outer membrane beta-barrel protein [Minwuia sp.]|nr:outer membrane beta-barrel protein [Minwuia sp.]